LEVEWTNASARMDEGAVSMYWQAMQECDARINSYNAQAISILNAYAPRINALDDQALALYAEYNSL